MCDLFCITRKENDFSLRDYFAFCGPGLLQRPEIESGGATKRFAKKAQSADNSDGVDKKVPRRWSKWRQLAWLAEKTSTSSLFNVHTYHDTSGFFRYVDSIAVLYCIHIYFTQTIYVFITS